MTFSPAAFFTLLATALPDSVPYSLVAIVVGALCSALVGVFFLLIKSRDKMEELMRESFAMSQQFAVIAADLNKNLEAAMQSNADVKTAVYALRDAVLKRTGGEL